MVTDATFFKDAIYLDDIPVDVLEPYTMKFTKPTQPDGTITFALEQEDNGSYTGVVHTSGRQQPYTVWYNGKICYFTETKAEAQKRLRAVTGGFV